MASKSEQLTDAEFSAKQSAASTDRQRPWTRRLWEGLRHSSAYLAVIAVAKVCIVLSVLSLPMNAAPGVAGLVTFAIYANDRLVDIEPDQLSNPARAGFVLRHQDALYVLGAVAYGLATALSLFGGPVAFALVVLPGVVWIAYAREWFPTNWTASRLKDILVVNSVVVAAAWAIPVVVVPVAFADASFGPTAVVLLVYFFLGTFVNVEIANIKDLPSDARNGVRTLPVVYGVARTRQALSVLTTLAVGVLVLASVTGYLSVLDTAVLAVGPLASYGVIALIGRVDRSHSLSVLAESSRLPVFVLLIVTGLFAS